MHEADAIVKLGRSLIRALPAGRTKAINLLISGLGLRGATVCGEFHSPPLRFAARLGETIDNQLFFNGVFEPIFTSLFLDLLHPGDVLFDVGANLGYYSLLGWQRVGSTGQVIAFEPDPNSIERLLTNRSLNNADAIQLCRKAISDSCGVARFQASSIDSSNQGGGSLGGETEGAIEVETTTLDAFLEGTGVNRIDLLKVDIEGGEALAIQGMKRTLEEKVVKAMLLEMHRDAVMRLGSSPEKLISDVKHYGFRCYRVRGVTARGVRKYQAVGQYELRPIETADFTSPLAHYCCVSQASDVFCDIESHIVQ